MSIELNGETLVGKPASEERAVLWQHLSMVQHLLVECLQQPVTQQTLAGHLSLYGFDYLAALYAVSQVFATTPFQVVSANTSIRIESNLPGLIGHLGTLSINAHCQLNTFEISGGRLKSETVPFSKLVRSQSVEPQAQRLIPQGVELFVETPRSFNFDAVTGETGITHQWQVRAQCVLEHANQRWHFPTPPPKDGTPFGETRSHPDFSREGELYWADEVTNKSKDSI